VVDAFNAQSETTQVERLQVSEMNDKLLTSIAGGTAPNVGVCCVAYAQLYARDVITPLDDYIDTSANIDKADFVPGLFESMTWQGVTYGVPAFEAGPRYGMIYNKAHVAEAGLDEGALPTTWEEAFEWHEALTQFDDAGNVNIVGFDPLDATGGNGPRANIPMFQAINGGKDIWDGETLTFQFDTEEFIGALERVKQFYDLVGVEQMSAFRSNAGGWTSSPSAAIPTGVQSMIITGYYAPGELSVTAPDKEFGVGWAPMPAGREGIKMQSVGGHPAYIPTGTSDPDGSFEFIEFLTSDEAAQIMFDVTGWIGGRTKFYDPNRSDLDKFPGLDWYLQSVQEADEMWACPVIPIDGFINQQRSQTFDNVIFGEKTPAEAAAAIQEACTEELRKEFPELVA
jgi:multiple sugar transport system substrate-binding protein